MIEAVEMIAESEQVEKGLMKAIIRTRYGPPDILQLKEVEKPTPNDVRRVLVRIYAASVNPADRYDMKGPPFLIRLVAPLFRLKVGLRGPRDPGLGTDAAGRVEAVANNVTQFKLGDEVFGACWGSYAEYAVAREDRLVLKPANISFEEASAVPIAAITALQALRDKGHIQPGQKVLVNGAGGGVGTFAVQIAKSFGAEVTAVTSTENLEMVRSLGADHVIDYTKENFTQTRQRYDFILDNVANRSLSDLRRALTPKGTLVPNGGGFDNHWFASGGRVMRAKVLSRFVSQTLRTFVMSPKQENLVVLKAFIEAGKVTPVIGRTYPLIETPQAIDHVGGGHARGKVVINA